MSKTATPLDQDDRSESMAETDNSSEGGSEVSNAAGGPAAGGIASLRNVQAINPPQEDAYWRELFLTARTSRAFQVLTTMDRLSVTASTPIRRTLAAASIQSNPTCPTAGAWRAVVRNSTGTASALPTALS